MAENKYATEGMLEDLLRSYVQLAATELHFKTLVERTHAEFFKLDNITYEEYLEKNGDVADISSSEHGYVKRLLDVTNLRRTQQRLIYELAGGKGDQHEWCPLKHLAMAMYTTFEAWQAKEDDVRLMNAYLAINDLFIESAATFMGMEITDCAACFTDNIKAMNNLNEGE